MNKQHNIILKVFNTNIYHNLYIKIQVLKNL